MNTIIGADAAKLARLLTDTLQKLQSGQITFNQWERFNNLSPADREARFGDCKKSEPTAPAKILEPVSTIVVNSTIGAFVAKERFVVNTRHGAQVRISRLGENFEAVFLNGDGKIEGPIKEQVLRYDKLRQPSTDGPIIAELGGKAKVKTTLSEMFSLMEKQGQGEHGALLNDGKANIFYIEDTAGVLRAVRAYWDIIGWDVGAASAIIEDRWDHDDQVFSRLSVPLSVLESSEPSPPAQA